jgi:hypothetical protein
VFVVASVLLAGIAAMGLTCVSRPVPGDRPAAAARIETVPVAAPVLATLPADPLPAIVERPAESIPHASAPAQPLAKWPDDPVTTGAIGSAALPPVEPLPPAEETAVLVRRMFNAPSVPAPAPESVPSPEPRPKSFDVDSASVSASR